MTRPEPTILAFDTSAAHCAAALLVGDRIVAERFEEMKKGQAERLFPMLEDVLRDDNASWNDLDALGVGIGPGNFTGVRIAVSAARGLALGLEIPAIGVSTFEVAESLAPSSRKEASRTAYLPAPQGRAYAQRFLGGEPEGKPWIVHDPSSDPLSIQPMNVAWSGSAVICIAKKAASTLLAGDKVPAPSPLYVRPPNAAPSSDPPPVILP